LAGLHVGTTSDLFAADAVLACSGTVTLELVLAGVPTVAAYRLSKISYQVARGLVTGVSYISLPNILLDEPLVHEHVQQLCPKRLAADLMLSAGQRQRFHDKAHALRELLDNGNAIENASRALEPWLGHPAVATR
jgi:lipid-A-disaccharide synthase